MIPLVDNMVQYYVNEQCVRDNNCFEYNRVGVNKTTFHIEYGKLTGKTTTSGIIPGSDQDDDDDSGSGAKGLFGARGQGQRSSAAKSGGAKSGGAQSGGWFNNLFGNLMGGRRGRGLARRAEQAELAEQADKGEHAKGRAWYCPAIRGMASILGTEELSGQIQTCAGTIVRTRVVA